MKIELNNSFNQLSIDLNYDDKGINEKNVKTFGFLTNDFTINTELVLNNIKSELVRNTELSTDTYITDGANYRYLPLENKDLILSILKEIDISVDLDKIKGYSKGIQSFVSIIDESLNFSQSTNKNGYFILRDFDKYLEHCLLSSLVYVFNTIGAKYPEKNFYYFISFQNSFIVSEFINENLFVLKKENEVIVKDKIEESPFCNSIYGNLSSFCGAKSLMGKNVIKIMEQQKKEKNLNIINQVGDDIIKNWYLNQK